MMVIILRVRSNTLRWLDVRLSLCMINRLLNIDGEITHDRPLLPAPPPPPPHGLKKQWRTPISYLQMVRVHHASL